MFSFKNINCVMQAKYRMYIFNVQSKKDGVKNCIEYRWLPPKQVNLELEIVNVNACKLLCSMPLIPRK